VTEEDKKDDENPKAEDAKKEENLPAKDGEKGAEKPKAEDGEKEEEKLQGQAEENKKKRDLTNKETQDLAKQNRERIAKMKGFLSEANAERKKRDDENAKVKEFKENRLKVENEVIKIREELDAKKARLRELGGDSNIPFEKLHRRIEELEWIQETEATTTRKEREISKQIKDLRKQLPSSEEAKGLFQNVNELRDNLSKFNREARDYRKQMETHARQSDVHHKAHIDSLKKGRALQEKIGATIAILDNKRGEANSAHKEYVSAQRKMQARGKAERDEIHREARARHAEMKERVAVQAKSVLEKFRSGEKLTMEEFLVLKESGLM